MDKRLLSTPDERRAFAIGILTGILVALAVVSIALLFYTALLFVIRKINLVAMGINETEFGAIYAAILRCRHEQQACLPREGKRTRWFKSMTLRALNGISHDEFVFLLRQAKETISRRDAVERNDDDDPENRPGIETKKKERRHHEGKPRLALGTRVVFHQASAAESGPT